MSTDQLFDVLILGAGPAGAAAAAFAASAGLRVAVLEQSAGPAEAPCPEWLHPDAHDLLDRAGVSSRDAVLGTIGELEFVDLAGGRTASAPLSPKMDIVDSARFTEAILAAANAAGARLIKGAAVSSIEAREEGVRLSTSDGERVAGRFLLAADGCDSFAARSLGLDASHGATPDSACCQSVWVRSESSAASSGTDSVRLKWILVPDDPTSFGYVFAVEPYVVAGLVASVQREEIRLLFEQAIGEWGSAGILPDGVDLARGRTEVRSVPRGIALEMETHVAKFGLVVGDAGGFVATVNHSGLYPAIWSAGLAVEACAAAAGAEHPQDVLAEFDAQWRQAMVAHLRMPNADLRFLLPLVFTNQRMAQRLAGALLGGRAL